MDSSRSFLQVRGIRRVFSAAAGETVALSPRNQITTRALPEYLEYRAQLLAQVFASDEVANVAAP
jgi:hypothetical protein